MASPLEQLFGGEDPRPLLAKYLSGFRDVLQGASNAAASSVSDPIDMINSGLGMLGLPVSAAPVGGSAWMAQRGLTRAPENANAGYLGEALGLSAPIAGVAKAPQIAGGLLRAGENLAAKRTVGAGMGGGQRGAIVLPAETDAMRVAQRNAAKPVSEGGLGLPPNNTAADRAAAMGFDTDAYHATTADFSEFKANPIRNASFFSATPDGALAGANAGMNDAMKGGRRAFQVMPVKLRSGDIAGLSIDAEARKWFSSLPDVVDEAGIERVIASRPSGSSWSHWYREVELPDGSFQYVKKAEPAISYADAARTARDAMGARIGHYSSASGERWAAQNALDRGFKGFLQQDEAGVAAAIVDPAAIRSRWAAFDPMLRNSANILAGGAPAAIGLPLFFDQSPE